ncbi:N-acetylmuramoyl-L-alanine amidase [Fictibacillus aquaticus]|uniref:SPOR domain-containing protein n=1 Tax=Fictibacillus aquaticus TaxID=2021314 RepID=A0A235FAI4_9BACL|nr:N-acetylmuramoyl-L-alanine amidase [Fictibacillus aquaticus]OYD58371.1 hypothetical protein CGZ90_00245 [Fictibacillus aquaticus]
MKKIMIDAGHGGSDPGAVNKNALEKNFNLSIAIKIKNYLEKNFEAEVLMTRSSDVTVELQERTDKANKAKTDFYLSVHQNSGGGEGFESYVYNGGVSKETIAFQNAVHAQAAEVIKKYGAADRGKKRADFHVLRETVMPAVLLEVLFLDNEKNLALLKNENFQLEIAKAAAEGTAKALKLPKREHKTVYLVIAGSFEEKSNGEERVQMLSAKKISSFVDTVKEGAKTLYRVQAGAFAERVYAEEQLKAVRAAGVQDAYILTKAENEPSKPEPKPEPKPQPADGFTIEGTAVLSADEMDRFARSVNPDAPKLASLYTQIATVYGIRADVAFAQAIQETGYFKFEGSVKPGQHNYAGLGAYENGKSASFKNPEEGVLAHIQHLYAYANVKPLPAGYPLVDPRFRYVARGSAPSWKQLNGKWAVPGGQYAQQILNIHRQMVNSVLQPLKNRVQNLEKRLDETKS